MEENIQTTAPVTEETAKNKNINLQELFLNVARKEKMLITMFLTNGFQIRGVVKGFDTYVVIIESEGKSQMVYKHAISTVIPSKNINVFTNV